MSGHHYRVALKENTAKIERTYAKLLDGTVQLLSTKIYPANPLPGVIYDDYGVPLPFDTAIEQRRLELEKKAEAERSRGKRNARAKSQRTKVRDKAIAAFAVRLAKSGGDLAENPGQLATVLLARWKDEWGLPVQPSTLRRILKEQRVASTLRRR